MWTSTNIPLLAWNWKVSELPAGGDFRHPLTDDQAAQVLVAFTDHRILTYIWDTSAPQGDLAIAPAPFLCSISSPWSAAPARRS